MLYACAVAHCLLLCTEEHPGKRLKTPKSCKLAKHDPRTGHILVPTVDNIEARFRPDDYSNSLIQVRHRHRAIVSD